MHSVEGPDGGNILFWEGCEHLIGGFARHRVPPEGGHVPQRHQNEGAIGDAGMGENQVIGCSGDLVRDRKVRPTLICFKIR